MVKKPKDKDQEESQGVGFIFSLGEGALGESRPLSQRIIGTGAYEILPTYRAGLYAEQAKIRYKDKTRQLLLDENLVSLLDADKKTAEYLPSFSYQDLKVYSAIQRFIDEQRKPGEDEEVEITFTPQEFFEYCGLKKTSRGTYSGKQKEEHLQTLWSLASTPKKIVQQQTELKKGKKKYKTYILTTPLLTVKSADIIESDTEEEAQDIMERAISGRELPKKRKTRYLVKPDPIMYKLLDRLYVRKAISQFEEIRTLHPGEKPNPYTHTFLDFIQTLDFSPLKVGRDTLAERIGLDGYLRQRKRTIVTNRINEALEDALATRYILSYQEELTGLLIIHLNPARCSRYQEKLVRTKTQEEKS